MFALETTKDALLAPLQIVMGAVREKSVLPILANVLIEPAGDHTALVATDLEIEITAYMPEAIASGAAVTVPAKKLRDICRALPEGQAIKLKLDGGQLKIAAGRSRFSLHTLPAQDFPRLQPTGPAAAAAVASERVRLSLSQQELRRLLVRVQYAMSVKETWHYLNNLLLSLQNNRLVAVGTDGHRLALDAVTLPGDYQDIDVILPRKAVQTLIKLLGNSETSVDVELSKYHVAFVTVEFELRSKVVDGTFPDYRPVIPSNNDKSFVIERRRLGEALARVAILAGEKYHKVRFMLESGRLCLSCVNDMQEEAQEELEIKYENAPLEIVFNAQYLLDVLNNLDAETIKCSLSDVNTAMLITIPDETHFCYVVMPMRL